MSTAEAIRRPVALQNRSSRPILIVPEDEDRFVIPEKVAVKACNDELDRSRREQEFSEEFLVPMIAWCESNKSKVRGCYVASQDRYVVSVFVVTTQVKYDFEFSGKLVELSRHFRDKDWSVQFNQVTSCSESELSSFFDIESSLEVYSHKPE
jgi:hypothetical protein